MSQVTRITHRYANTDTSHEYEQLIGGMLDDCSKAKGYLNIPFVNCIQKPMRALRANQM